MKNLFALCLSAVATTATATAQIPIPEHHHSQNAVGTGGYFFRVPAAMTVIDLEVPDEQKAGMQMVALYRLNAPPGEMPGMPVQPLFFKDNVPSGQRIAVSPGIAFQAGEYLVVLGGAGVAAGRVETSNGNDSFPSQVLGNPILLTNCYMSSNLAAVKGVGSVFHQRQGWIGRVRVGVGGQASAESYGAGSGFGSIPPGELLRADAKPPILGSTGGLILKPGTANNNHALIAIALHRSSIPTPVGTFLNAPFVLLHSEPGPIATQGLGVDFPIPNNLAFFGGRLTFQAAVVVPNGFTLTNGVEWRFGF